LRDCNVEFRINFDGISGSFKLITFHFKLFAVIALLLLLLPSAPFLPALCVPEGNDLTENIRKRAKKFFRFNEIDK